MIRVAILCLAAFSTGGCGTLNSVPFPQNANSLDGDAVRFTRAVPMVDLGQLSDQAGRAGQAHPDAEVMVAISGGGARATAFTLGVLAELETLELWTSVQGRRNALQEIDYFSTVSGGGWGAAAYVADRHFSGDPAYRIWDRVPAIRASFLAAARTRSSCLPAKLDGVTSRNGTPLLLSDIFGTPPGQAPRLPYLFLNAAVQSDQHPFVFTPEFARHYRIRSFDFCDREVQLQDPGSIGEVKLSEAMATSGSVPGFYYATAQSAICDPGSDMAGSFFCKSPRRRARYTQISLVDGGVYDNRGVYTAVEVLSQTPRTRRRVLIMIDSNADTEIPFTVPRRRAKLGMFAEAGMMAGFPARTAAFQRTLAPWLEELEIRPVLLDFAVAAGLRDTVLANGRNSLEGLTSLSRYARTGINCFNDTGAYVSARRGRTSWEFADCRENNYYRAGLMNKTTYFFDHGFFNTSFELGRLAVRLRADELQQAIFGSAQDGRSR